MKDSELIEKVHSAVYHQCQRRGYAAPVDVLMEIGVLPKQKYEEWRFGKIPYLEKSGTGSENILRFLLTEEVKMDIMCLLNKHTLKRG